MLLTLLLQSSWPTLHPVVLLVFGAVLTALATWLWKLRDERRAARLAAEQALRDEIKAIREALKTETQARVQWQLENDGDLERIAGILKDVNETQKLTAALAATSQHHNGELLRIDRRIEQVSQQLTQFVMDHAKHT